MSLPEHAIHKDMMFMNEGRPPWLSGQIESETSPECTLRSSTARHKGRFRKWKKASSSRQYESPEYFDYESLEDQSPAMELNLSQMNKSDHCEGFTISTPPSAKLDKSVGIQVSVKTREVGTQTGGKRADKELDDGEQELSDTEIIDGILCKDLCMAVPQNNKVQSQEPNSFDENGFYKLKNGMTSDSGAGDTVGPEEEFPDYPTVPSPGSKKGLHYVAAGGTKIKNTGQKRVLIFTKERQLRWCTVQIAQVKKTLASVSKNNDYGFEVRYSNSKGSYMEHEKTGEKTMLRRERGVFVLDAWVVPYKMAKSGIVKYTDDDGKMKTVKVGMKNESDFIRPAP